MADKKKSSGKTIEEKLKFYQSFHGKDFKERISAFEDLHDEEKGDMLFFQQHANYVVRGHPTDKKNFPGAYNEAYKVLDKHVKNDTDKLNDLDKIGEIMEKYVDSFLQKAVGKKYDEALKLARKDKLDKDQLRKLKSNFFDQYYRTDRNSPSILSEENFKTYKGKTKLQMIGELEKIANSNLKGYSGYLASKAQSPLVHEHDIPHMAKYITPIFKKAGFEPKDPHLTQDVQSLYNSYATLLTGGSLGELGYKRIKEEKKPEKKK